MGTTYFGEDPPLSTPTPTQPRHTTMGCSASKRNDHSWTAPAVKIQRRTHDRHLCLVTRRRSSELIRTVQLSTGLWVNTKGGRHTEMRAPSPASHLNQRRLSY